MKVLDGMAFARFVSERGPPYRATDLFDDVSFLVFFLLFLQLISKYCTIWRSFVSEIEINAVGKHIHTIRITKQQSD